MAAQHTEGLESYWANRDFRTSARLHLQHWLFQSTLGFTLHPTIAAALPSDQPLRVADLACGNGAWLTELSRSRPNSTLTGYDINPTLFPSASFLPKGVTLHAHDILTAPPADALGTYDLVHVRAWASLVKDNDLSPVLEPALKLLKPGGWIQWEEADLNSQTAIDPEGKGRESSERLLMIMKEGAKGRRLFYDWTHNFPELLSKQGFENVESKFYDPLPEQYKAWTENYLTVWEEVALMLPSKEQVPDAPLSREMYQGLFRAVVEETTKGVAVLTTKLVVAVGRKAN